jgi:hypothetical protein
LRILPIRVLVGRTYFINRPFAAVELIEKPSLMDLRQKGLISFKHFIYPFNPYLELLLRLF